MSVKDKIGGGKAISNRQFDLQKEYESMMKELNVSESYHLSRIPRPEEIDNNEEQTKKEKEKRLKNN
jgi:hypothetical protein